MHITDTEVLQGFHSFFMNAILSTTSDIKAETPKRDLGISGVCYIHTMLIINKNEIYLLEREQ